MLFVTNCVQGDESSGVNKKIAGQIQAFNNAGLGCRWYEIEHRNPNQGWFREKLNKRLPFTNRHEHWKMEDFVNEDNIYIRYFGNITPAMNVFFCQLHKKNPACKIVLEFPTYPYDEEYKKKRLKDRMYLYTDRYSRKKLSTWVNRVATLTDDKMIFGVPTIKFRNGIDMDALRPREAQIDDTVQMIAVSGFAIWHGYDRLLEGLHDYYQMGGTRNIIFHLVGDGPERIRYSEMVEQYQLKEHVVFHGLKSGKALDDVYDKCGLGIASLGFHRTGLTEGAPLKTREYIAKGIPFIFGAKVSDIPDDVAKDIYLQVPNDDTHIDILKVLSFYDKIYKDPVEKVIARFRKYAEVNFSMDTAMKDVIVFFKSNDR